MKKVLFLLLILLQSCEFFQQKKINEKAIYNAEIKKINFKNVDTSPSFILCDSLTTPEQKNNCFYNTIANFIYKNIDKKAFSSLLKTDSLNLKITISNKAQILFNNNSNNKVLNLKIDSILKEKLYFHPKIKPATKNKIAVTSFFNIPIKLK